MDLYDAHSHHPSPVALLNERPLGFTPHQGQYYSLGIHPWQADCDNMQAWEALQTYAAHPQVLAIGETGLDKICGADWARQQVLFSQQAQLAGEIGKPLVIHCVRSAAEVIGLKKSLRSAVPWIIHGFRGNRELAAQFLRHGFWLSFGEKYQEETLKSVPPGRMLIETDESRADLWELYRRAAVLLGIPQAELIRRTGRNMKDLFFSRQVL